MTQEQHEFYEAEFVGLPIPGTQYATVHVWLGSSDEKVREALERARRWAEIWASVFGESGRAPQERPSPVHGVIQPPYEQQRSAPAQARSGGTGLPRLLCPEHNVELQPSVKNRATDFVEGEGEIHASWFHQLPKGGTHTVYQSKARRG